MNHTNILIVSENYTFGGLETHLYGKIKHLSNNGYNVFLVTGTSFLENNLPHSFCKKIFTGIDLSVEANAQRIVQTAKKLAGIIEENDIAVVDIHPHLSALPAFFSAFLTERPFSYTIHGPASIMEDFGLLLEWFTKCILLDTASLVGNVSEETQQLTKNYVDSSRNQIFRNGVDTTVFRPNPKDKNKYDKCCIVSRLDNAKVNGIRAFLTLAYSTDISQIDIFGDGPEFNGLQEWISQTNTGNKQIGLKGASLNIREAYNDYGIVAGMGRVVLEAAALNKAVVLVGYDGVKGILNESLMNEVSYANFSGRGLENIDAAELVKQLGELNTNDRPYLLSSWVQKDASEKNIWKTFAGQLEKVKPVKNEIVSDLYQCFLTHQSASPYISDYDLLIKIKKLLRSKNYINSNAHRFMTDYDQKEILHSIQEVGNSLLNEFKNSVSRFETGFENVRKTAAENGDIKNQKDLLEIKFLQEAKQVLEKQLIEKQYLADRLESGLKESAAELALSKSSKDDLEQRLKRESERAGKQETELIAKEKSIRELKTELEKITLQLKQEKIVWEEQLIDSRKQTESLKADLEKASVQLSFKSILEDELVKKVQLIESLKNELSDTQKKGETASSENEKKLQAFKKELDKAKVEIGIKTLIEEQLEEKKHLINTLKKEIATEKEAGQSMHNSINELNEYVIKLEKHLKWYKETFEDRSIWGIIKDKTVKSRVPKK